MDRAPFHTSACGAGDVGVDTYDDGLAVDNRIRLLVAMRRSHDQRFTAYVVHHISGIM